MDKNKQKRLEAAGWKVGSVSDFLDLTPAENEYIELKLRLSNALKRRRGELNLSQEKFAKVIRSSQSRVAKMETGDPSVSIDLLVRGLIISGVNAKGLSRIIGSASK